jgi:hypothetical protein
MTRDEIHRWILSLQPGWMARLPYAIRESLSGLMVLPLLFWMPGSHWEALAAFMLGSLLYEYVLPGPKFSDVMARGVGATVVFAIYVVLV